MPPVDGSGVSPAVLESNAVPLVPKLGAPTPNACDNACEPGDAEVCTPLLPPPPLPPLLPPPLLDDLPLVEGVYD